MKKSGILFVLLAVLTAFFLLVTPGFAAEITESGECGESVFWTLDSDGLLTISGTGAITEKPWTEGDLSRIKALVISEGVTEIPWGAFWNCTALKEVTIPKSMRQIEDAFEECTALETLHYAGSTAEFSEIEIAFPCNEALTDLMPGYCYTGMCGDHLRWRIDQTGKLTVSGEGAMYNFGMSSSAEWCGNEKIITAEFLSGVRTIGSQTFSGPSFIIGGCSGLREVLIADTVTSIGEYAFNGCTALRNIYLPKSVSSIAPTAYHRCSQLEKIEVDPANPWFCSDADGVLYNKDKTVLVRYPAGLKLTSYTVPDGVTAIEADAFEGAENLREIRLPDTVERIGKDAFDKTGYLKDRENWDGDLLYLGKALIAADPEISGKVSLRSDTVCIAAGAFSSCEQLTQVTLPEGLKLIDDRVFSECRKLETVEIPAGVTSIGSYAFSYCNSLKTAVLPEGITGIGAYAFTGCSSLSEISLPASLTEIGDGAFSYCSALTGVSVPKGVSVIAERTFEACEGLRKVSLSAGLTDIYPYAFSGCGNLAEITLPDRLLLISDGAFDGCDALQRVSLPKGMLLCMPGAFPEATAVSGSVQDLSGEPEWYEGGQYAGNILLKVSPEAAGEFTVRPGTVAIADYAFEGNNAVTVCRLPDSVVYIGEWVFFGCKNLFEVHVPSSVRYIGGVAIGYMFFGAGATYRGDVTIYGDPAGSAAQRYAQQHGLLFVEEKAPESGGIFYCLPCKASDMLRSLGDGAAISRADGSLLKAEDPVGSGMILTKPDGTRQTVVVPGDVTGDGRITAADARAALRQAVGLDRPKDWEKAAALVNGGEKVNAAAARKILRIAVGLDQPTLNTK